LAATPLGNYQDASDRLRIAIEKAEVILAEDSRRFHRLAKDLGLTYRAEVISFFEGNEVDRIAQVVALLESGKEILALTDAGMPAISDPGFRLVRAAIENNLPLKVLPGPSAVTTALVLSGLPSERFIFEGFIARTSAARQKYFADIKGETRTLIYFESPHRVIDFLKDAIEVLGPKRSVALCREMTKEYEEIVRGSLQTALDWANSKEMLGEFTIVLAGQDETQKWSGEQVLAAIANYQSIGYTNKDAQKQVADESGWSKREIFDLLVSEKK
jgi:16S rRNA (cytidine1402-2'-O)-methyltransferase